MSGVERTNLIERRALSHSVLHCWESGSQTVRKTAGVEKGKKVNSQMLCYSTTTLSFPPWKWQMQSTIRTYTCSVMVTRKCILHQQMRLMARVWGQLGSDCQHSEHHHVTVSNFSQVQKWHQQIKWRVHQENARSSSSSGVWQKQPWKQQQSWQKSWNLARRRLQGVCHTRVVRDPQWSQCDPLLLFLLPAEEIFANLRWSNQTRLLEANHSCWSRWEMEEHPWAT